MVIDLHFHYICSKILTKMNSQVHFCRQNCPNIQNTIEIVL